MFMTNRIKIRIYNKEYNLFTEETEEYSSALASELDSKMRGLIDKNSAVSPCDAAVLCALDALDAAKKEKESADNMRAQIRKYSDEALEANKRLEIEKKENKALKAKIEKLEAELLG